MIAGYSSMWSRRGPSLSSPFSLVPAMVRFFQSRGSNERTDGASRPVRTACAFQMPPTLPEDLLRKRRRTSAVEETVRTIELREHLIGNATLLCGAKTRRTDILRDKAR